MLKRVLLASISILAAAALLRSEPVHAQGSVGAPGIQGGIPCFQGGSCGFSNTYVTQGGHINFGPTQGDAGYGFRDNGGVIQFKNAGDSGWSFPLSTTGDASGTLSKATGSTTPRSQADWFSDTINVKAHGAKGDGLSYTDGTIAASGSAFSSASATFSANDCHSGSGCAGPVDKYIILHGSGASSAPQKGTITGFTDSHHVTVSFTSTLATPWNGTWNATPTALTGTGYVPAQTLTLVGGTSTAAAVYNIATTALSSATVSAGGSGGSTPPIACTLTGTTGTGGKFQVTGTVASGAISGTLVVSYGGIYTANPSSLSAEPVTGCGLTGATLALHMMPGTLTSNNPGNYSALPSSPAATTTSGSGTGATLTPSTAQIGGWFSYATDDTTAITNATAYALTVNKSVYFPAGAYWLATQSTPIPLTHIKYIGDGPPLADFPLNGGTTLWIDNASTAAFNNMNGVTIQDMAFYYPAQDGSQASPIVYPALWESNYLVNNTFINDRVVNAYTCRHAAGDGAPGIGRVKLQGALEYCIDKNFYLQNGAPDVIQIDSTSIFGANAGIQNVSWGPANLANYTQTNGTFFYGDPTASVGGYPNIDGLEWTGMFVHGYRYGIRMMSGLLDVSTLTGTNWETAKVFSLEGSAVASGVTFNGGYIWSAGVLPTQADTVFNFNSSKSWASDFTINNMNFAYAQGGIVLDTATLRTLSFNGNKLINYGQSTTAGSYYGVASTNGQFLNSIITANSIECNSPGTSFIYGVTLASGLSQTINDNWFSRCVGAVQVSGSSGVSIFNGNSSVNTAGSAAITDTSTGTAISYYGTNAWDKAPVPRAPTISACGTSPSVASGGSWQKSAITVGSGTVTACTETFPTPLPTTPICFATSNSASVSAAITSASASAVTIGLSGNLGGGVINLICQAP